MQDKYKAWLVVLGLTIVTLAVFWQVHDFEFVNYDDDQICQRRMSISGPALTWKISSGFLQMSMSAIGIR